MTSFRFSSELTRRVLFPVLQRRWRPTATRQLRELRKLEFAPRETIQRVQWGKLVDLLRFAALNVPYYRDLFKRHGIQVDEIRSPQDIVRIPILRKEIIRANSRDLLQEGIDFNQLHANASGGSTGKPLTFYQDDYYWDYAFGSQWFVESWWGIRPGDPTARIWGTDRDLPKLGWRERLATAICQARVCNAFALSGERMEGFAKMLHNWQPRFIVGYSTALGLLARFVSERPYLQIRPHAIKSTAETLLVEDRKVIEATFKCPVYNFYGSREVNNLAAECADREGLHINALGRYIEIVDSFGRPVKPGVLGRILVTDLTNFAMPFIRYEIEDIGAWCETACGCGRAFPMLSAIHGRKSDFFVTPAGKLIHGEYFTHLFYGLPEVSQFQLVQDSVDLVHAEIVLRAGASECVLDSIRNRIADSMGTGVRCVITTVKEIKRPLSGKHRFTISKVPLPWENLNRMAGELGEKRAQ